MSAENDIEKAVVDLLDVDTYFKDYDIRYSGDDSEAKKPGVIVECEPKQPDIADAAGKTVSWRTRLIVSPVTFAADDLNAVDMEVMADNANRFVEALTSATIQAKLAAGYKVIGIEADASDKKTDDRWNERSVSRNVFFIMP